MSKDIIGSLVADMKKHGYEPANVSDIKADDKWHDYQIAGDPPKKKKGYCCLKIDGDFAVACYGDRRIGENIGWHSKANKDWSPEEKKAWKDRVQKERDEREARLVEAYDKAAAEARSIVSKSESADPEHEYLVRKGIKPYSLKQTGKKLVVPMYIDSKTIRSLQYIYPDGDKMYLTGGQKKGCFFVICGPDDSKDKIIVTEGVATAISIYEITGIPCVIAFDAANLKPVAVHFKSKYPASEIIVAADNDQWRFDPKKKPKDMDAKSLPGDDERWAQWRDEGKLHNIGYEMARQAALAVQGKVAVPDIPADCAEKWTDFNDMAVNYGIDAVVESLSGVLEAADTALEAMEVLASHAPDESEYDDDEPMGDIPGVPLRVLGYDGNKYFYYPFKRKQVVELTTSEHNIGNIQALAPIDTWTQAFNPTGERSESINSLVTPIRERLFRTAEIKGPFEARKVRGAGAWMDAGRLIINSGRECYVDGKKARIESIVGAYTYVSSHVRIPLSDTPLTPEEGKEFREICEAPSWENKLYGKVVAGWVVISQVCSMLSWRPHIYITGEASAGKSTILDHIIKEAVGPIAYAVDGGTTEAKIREDLKNDGRPMIYDEAETDGTAATKKMEPIIELARKAADGGNVGKYGKNFYAQFAACFSGVDPMVKTTADATRIIMLSLMKDRSEAAQERYNQLKARIKSLITKDFSARLFARTSKNLETLLDNIDTFYIEASKILSSSRAAQNVAAIMAGLYLLESEELVTPEEAAEWIQREDWSDHMEAHEESQPMELLSNICMSSIDLMTTVGRKQVTIGDLIGAIIDARRNDTVISPEEADKKLREYGIKVDMGEQAVHFANTNKNLGRVLSGTTWSTGSKGWKEQLKRIPGAKKPKGPVYFMRGVSNQRTIAIPFKHFMDEREDKLPLDKGASYGEEKQLH